MDSLYRLRGSIGMVIGAAIGFATAGRVCGGYLWPFPAMALLGGVVGYFAARNAKHG